MDPESLQKEFDHIFEFSEIIDTLEQNKDVCNKNSDESNKVRKLGNHLFQSYCIKHDKELHRTVLSSYTKSIAFAPVDSEELAFGYSNRSALLLHLFQFENCLIDIDRALKIAKSEKLKEKLVSRKANCLKLQKEYIGKHPEIQNGQFKRPVIKEYSKEIPSASECVTLEFDEIMGSRLIATRDIEVGEIVIIEEANTAMLIQQQMYVYCAHCLNFTMNALPCEFCPFAVYCNEECKEAAWKKYHDMECPMLQYFYYHLFENKEDIVHFLLASKIFITALKREGLESLIQEMKNIHDKSSEILMHFFK